MDEEIHAQGLAGSTAIIVTAKHGQSPQDPEPADADRRRPDHRRDQRGVDRGAPRRRQPDRRRHRRRLCGRATCRTARRRRRTSSRTTCGTTPRPGVNYSGGTRTLAPLRLGADIAGQAAANFFGVPVSDPRHPDVFGVVQVGVVYTTAARSRSTAATTPRTGTCRSWSTRRDGEAGLHGHMVETTSVAPTILALLGLNPSELQAVQIEGTRVLPGIGH